MQETTAQERVSPPMPKLRAQRIGRRVGVEHYYTIVEQTAERLTLRSRRELNRPASNGFILVSALLGLPALALLVLGIAYTPRIGLAGMLLVLPGLLIGTVALAANTIGRALRRLVNTISVDRAERSVRFEQRISAGAPKKQILRFDLISGLSLRRRNVKLFPAFLGRQRSLAMLELRTVDGHYWLVDSAADTLALLPAAQALATLLELPIERATE